MQHEGSRFLEKECEQFPFAVIQYLWYSCAVFDIYAAIARDMKPNFFVFLNVKVRSYAASYRKEKPFIAHRRDLSLIYAGFIACGGEKEKKMGIIARIYCFW
jgi:hypothetical protein